MEAGGRMNPHPESRWTHPICRDCYEDEAPGREPYRMVEPELKVCCWCGQDTREGIFYREDPALLHPEPRYPEVAR